MHLVLVRHCETDWNKKRIVQGHTDIELNENGRKQAKQLAVGLQSLGISVIYSSDLLRAAQTANIIAHSLGISAYQDNCLRECSFGSLEGKTAEEFDRLANRSGTRQERMKNYDYTKFGGESRSQVLKRMLEVINRISALHNGSLPLLVSHGNVLDTLLQYLGHDIPLLQGSYRIIEFM